MPLPLTITIIVISLLILFLAFILIASYATYKMIFKRKRRDYDPLYGLDKPAYAVHKDTVIRMVGRISEEPFEPVSIIARDGVRLYGRYYHRSDGAPIHLICHGYKSSPLRDGAGGGLDALRLGHNLLLIYQRAHGESEGETITFGILERYDIRDWASYLTDRLGEDAEIILIGTSMGGASVLMAAELDLPKTVKCIISDCPYSKPKDIILSVAKQRGYPPALVYPFIRLGARIFGGFDLEAVSGIEAIKHSGIPILIAHGEADTLVPQKMSRELHRAALEAGVDCTLMTFPGAEHCLSFITNYDSYVEKRDIFLKKHIKHFSRTEGGNE
ncbi:MAG: alpha/beta hydrolase [Clostridia bacterium]|nr:alpha/beta hydrolase [Clostridia bacterium]